MHAFPLRISNSMPHSAAINGIASWNELLISFYIKLLSYLIVLLVCVSTSNIRKPGVSITVPCGHFMPNGKDHLSAFLPPSDRAGTRAAR